MQFIIALCAGVAATESLSFTQYLTAKAVHDLKILPLMPLVESSASPPVTLQSLQSCIDDTPPPPKKSNVSDSHQSSPRKSARSSRHRRSTEKATLTPATRRPRSNSCSGNEPRSKRRIPRNSCKGGSRETAATIKPDVAVSIDSTISDGVVSKATERELDEEFASIQKNTRVSG